jgi:Xaa-Pro aminopeptidase
MIFMQRLQNLRSKLLPDGPDGLLIGSSPNRRYLSGFRGSAGWLLVTPSAAFLAVDFRYVEQARQEAGGCEILHITGDLQSWLPGLAAKLGVSKLGVEAEHTAYSTYQSIAQIAKTASPAFSVLPVKNMVESLRAVKDGTELSAVEKACRIADEAIRGLAARLEAGATEKQVAWDLESLLRQQGSETLPFEIIVASGPNAALPHAQPSDREISQGETVIIDFGARCGGYCSDITRTFMIGDGTEKFNTVYNIVLGAQMTALSLIEKGMAARSADALARGMIEKAGYGEFFGHGLGHGIGLETHESPRIGALSEDVLQDDMVFTVEPGIYLPGWGGVRIEDTVTIADGKLRKLTHAAKKSCIKGGN